MGLRVDLFYTTRGQSVIPESLPLSVVQVHHHQHNEKIKPYVQNDLKGAGSSGNLFKEQHIVIYGPLNEVVGAFFFAQTLNIFLYIDVRIFIYIYSYFKKWCIYINLQITYTSPVEEIHSTLCIHKLLYM